MDLGRKNEFILWEKIFHDLHVEVLREIDFKVSLDVRIQTRFLSLESIDGIYGKNIWI
jgi:hypothetical protein